jgi:glycogen operon protein
MDERHLVEHGLKNYWGYNTLSFFALEQRYDTENVQNAFRSTVAELHSAGIEVLLDVVYNHTCEGNHLGPTHCYRGIDNTAYYWLLPDQPRFYENYTGTGNALKLTHPRVLQMVMDSLRYWVEVFHIDGFRFDLASTLGRVPAFDQHASFFAAVRQDPVLANVKLIAEPWDIGLGGYQVGGFPPGWSEWNDVYRNTMRRYWRGEGSLLGELAGSLTGSAHLYRHDGRAPQASVNHVTVHDGFTLADLVSYEHKHNEANKEDNRDGSDDNNSLNCGAEGPSDDPKILTCRRLLRRNQLASLLLAMGVPLMLAGDEVANSQDGNNNAYCQDDEIGWVRWSGLGTEDDHTEFIGGMVRLRQRFAQLRTRHWLEGKNGDGNHDVIWLRPDAAEMGEEDWKFPEGRFLAYVLAPPPAGGEPLFLVFNAAPEAIEVTLPTIPGIAKWLRVLGTADNSVLKEDVSEPPGAKLTSPASSILGFAGKP